MTVNMVLVADVTAGIAPLTVNFDASGSTDYAIIDWNILEVPLSGTTQTALFTEPGVYLVTATAWADADRSGLSDSQAITITVSSAPDVVVYAGTVPLTGYQTLLTGLLHDEFMRPFSSTGTGKIRMSIDDPQRSLLFEGQMLTWIDTSTGDPVCKIYVEDWDYRVVDEAEEQSMYVEYVGSTVPGRYRHAIVYPQGGIYEVPPGDPRFQGLRLGFRPASANRYFNWATPELSYASWPNAVNRYQACSAAASAGAPTGRWGKPDGWLDGGAYWIWSRALVGTSDPTGTSLFRAAFDAGAGGSFIIDVACDDAFVLWVNGIPVLAFDNPPSIDGWAKTHSVEVNLSGGINHIGIAATNYFSGTPAGLLCSVRTQPQGMGAGQNETIILNSNSSWSCLDYPPKFPSWTPGGVWIKLMTEAHARGTFVTPAASGATLPFFTNDFTALVDSDGTPWPPIGELVLRVGDDYEKVLAQLTETWIEWDMPPDLGPGYTLGAGHRLQMWVQEGVPLAGYSGNPAEPLGTGVLAPGHSTATSVAIARGVNARSIVRRYRGG